MAEPRAYRHEDRFAAAVAAVEAKLGSDVLRVNYEFRDDWTGDPSVFFLVTVPDEVFTERRSAEVAEKLSWVIRSEIEPWEEWDVRSYFRYQRASTQQRLQEPALA